MIGPNSSACFYHGLVLGLMVELADRYVLISNRESGFGRYDVMLEPKNAQDDGIIMEFKVQDIEEEKELLDTINAALQQIEEKKYEKSLLAKGFPGERIHKYGFAFQGKKVLIGKKQKLSKNNHKLIFRQKYAELLIETTGTFR